MPILQGPDVLDFISHSPTQTRRLGARLARLLFPGAVVALFGPLGAGKTAFVQGLAEGLGIGDPVTSPSFTLIQTYPFLRGEWRGVLYHVDLYRLEGPTDLEDVGLEDVFADDEGLVAVEWADRAGPFLPPERLEIHLEILAEGKRRMRWTPRGEAYRALVRRFYQATFSPRNRG